MSEEKSNDIGQPSMEWDLMSDRGAAGQSRLSLERRAIRRIDMDQAIYCLENRRCETS
jgi:hypothetical protein